MKNKKYILPASIALVLAAVVWHLAPGTIPAVRAQTTEAGHEGHDHAKHAEDKDDRDKHGEDKDDHDKHEGEDEHKGHDDHDDPGVVIPVTAAQMKKLKIFLSSASAGKLHKEIRLPGEIAIDADHSAHIVPRASGVVRKVLAKVGDRVKTGDVLAVLDSAELGAAKILYLTKMNELSCCAMELARAEAIDANTVKLLQMLDKSPDLDSLTKIKFTDMGSGHSTLISAYAELVFTKAEYQREKKLFEEKITSKGDYLTAASAYKKAYATYTAARSSIAYESRRGFLEARQSRLTLELALRAEDRKLRLLGMAPCDIESLRAAAGTSPVAKKHECNDPNCKDCKPAKPAKAKPVKPAKDDHDKDKGDHDDHGKDDHDDHDKNKAVKPAKAEHADHDKDKGDHADHDEHCKDVLDEGLGQYALRAPFDGIVIQKHIVLGEKITDAEAFTIADMSKVWINLSVYQKDLPFVKKGQKVHISVGYGIPAAEGEISLVSPIVDETTRTCLARVVLANEKGRYRPGLFVTAEVKVSSFNIPVLVPGKAVMRIEGKSCVFVATDKGLRQTFVKTGRSSRTHVEIVSGLKADQQYVSTGAFQLKARIITSGLDPHAGHGH